MSKYFRQINVPPLVFIILLLVFILAIFFYNKIIEPYSVISYADAPNNDIGLLDVTDLSGNWTINSDQQLNGINYGGKNCRNVCDNLAGCVGFLFATTSETTGTCTFKSKISEKKLNQQFNYYLNIK